MAKWSKGQSGNPGGREKGAERRAREALDSRQYVAKNGVTYTGKEIPYQVLIDIATNVDEKSRDRVSAANALLDRAEGKPKAHVEISGEVENTVDVAKFAALTAAQLEALALLDEEQSDGDAAVPATTH